MKSQDDRKEKSFEAALKRLEEIVSEMERGDLSLDAMLKKFEEGKQLAKFCSKKLEEAEKRIEVLIKKEDGSFATREFLTPKQAAEEDFSPEDEESEEEDEQNEEPLF